ncbi:MAG: glycosyltransferase [Bacteroidaceae bacterium]|nr:glycosyltransferase [Bacteroidaceae bacterium]
MKKIFFLANSMNVGGVEKAFLGLLSAIPLDKYEVHLGLINKKGGFLDYLPKEVKIHEIAVYQKYWRLINDPPLQYIKEFILKGNIIDALVHLFLYIQFKLSGNRYWFYKYLLRNEPMMAEKFDLAVAFASPFSTIDYYVCEKVNAPIKCGWIHFDVSKFGIDKGMTSQLYINFQKIFIVSETAKEIFDSIFPQFKSKTEVFYNILSPDQVIRLADSGDSFIDNYKGKRILTVGRISEEKGQRVAIEALKILLNKGVDVKWYYVGDGKDRSYCETLAENLGISDNVVFLGTQTNPYGFMKDCDLYMQPSRHEGFCITLAEALCFSKPIVATNFTGAKEQLQHRPNGVVTGMSAEEISEGVIIALEKGQLKNMEKPLLRNDISKLLNLLQ